MDQFGYTISGLFPKLIETCELASGMTRERCVGRRL